MKNKKILFAVVITVLLFVFSFSGCAVFSGLVSFPLNDILGVWEGVYTAGQGETGLTLSVYQEAGEVRALFKFYNLPGRTNAAEGSYNMKGSYDSQTKTHTFRGYEWISQPPDYGFADIQGTVNNGVYEGTLLGSNYTFRLVKQSEK